MRPGWPPTAPGSTLRNRSTNGGRGEAMAASKRFRFTLHVPRWQKKTWSLLPFPHVVHVLSATFRLLCGQQTPGERRRWRCVQRPGHGAWAERDGGTLRQPVVGRPASQGGRRAAFQPRRCWGGHTTASCGFSECAVVGSMIPATGAKRQPCATQRAPCAAEGDFGQPLLGPGPGPAGLPALARVGLALHHPPRPCPARTWGHGSRRDSRISWLSNHNRSESGSWLNCWREKPAAPGRRAGGAHSSSSSRRTSSLRACALLANAWTSATRPPIPGPRNLVS